MFKKIFFFQKMLPFVR